MSSSPATPTVMEVEVKIRLPNKEAHAAVRAHLGGPEACKAVHEQENLFFDGPNKELSSQRAVFRLRFAGGTCRPCLKEKAVIIDGVSRVPETEDDADYEIARQVAADPSKFPLLKSGVCDIIRSRFTPEIIALGGFRNSREVYDFAGHKLELDTTHFHFGTAYEIEVETAQPEEIKAQLEEMLNSIGVDYKYSTKSKFVHFREKSLE